MADPRGPVPAISVLIADDQRLVRAGFRVILAAEPDIAVVAEAADGAEAVELTRALAPYVVLMDIPMPRMDGLAVKTHVSRILLKLGLRDWVQAVDRLRVRLHRPRRPVLATQYQAEWTAAVVV